jgi:hypothetical protein
VIVDHSAGTVLAGTAAITYRQMRLNFRERSGAAFHDCTNLPIADGVA